MSQEMWDSFEKILASVEEDESLRHAENPAQSLETESEAEPRTAENSGLGAILSHPELLIKLPSLLKAVQELSKPTTLPVEKRPDTPVALLCALRPYLSEHRQRALDTMIRVSKLTETLRTMR